MSLTIIRHTLATRRRAIPAALGALLLVAALPARAGEKAAQRTFASPDAAAAALVQAIQSDDLAALRAIFGPAGEDIVSSGDDVADASARKHAADLAAELTRVDTQGDARAELVLGKEEWPFPVPIVKEGDTWRFDTVAGEDEIVNRRIGRNELHTIDTLRAVVDAQDDYAAADRDGKGPGAFAAKFASTEGKRDGLYWNAADGEPQSPLGPLIAEAFEEGYRRKDSQPVPFHGYIFRILTSQGPDAPGGAKSYLVNGRLTGGFAVVAYPADYGSSGIMTFVVNQQGILFQKNLGPNTQAIAAGMTDYDPDGTWAPVTD